MTGGQPDSETLPSALDEFDRMRPRITRRCVAVFLDYDGTLTPIVERPEDAVLAETMRAAVGTLARFAPVTIVSGRSLDEVRRLVDIATLWYAGSHGFEISGPDGRSLDYEGGEAFAAAIAEAERALRERLDIAGAWVESKKLAIAVHYRQAAQEDVAAIEALVDAVAAEQPRLRKSGGKKVFELRPRVDWHKGTAVLRLLDVLGLSEARALPIYIGDDVTDEDAFQSLAGRGIGIVVRADAQSDSAAEFSLRNPDEVEEFLRRLASELE